MALTADAGTDLDCFPDVSPSGSFVSGNTALAQALLRRLTTPRGGLFYDPNYGTDVRAFVNDAVSPDRVSVFQQQIEREVTADERVLNASAQVSFNTQTNTITAHLSMQTTNGPFNLTLGISSLSVTLLKAG